MTLLFANKLFFRNHGISPEPYLLPYIPPRINELQEMFLEANKKRISEQIDFPQMSNPVNGQESWKDETVKITIPTMIITKRYSKNNEM